MPFISFYILPGTHMWGHSALCIRGGAGREEAGVCEPLQMPWLSFAQGGLSLKSSCTGSTLHKGTTTKEHHSHCRFKDWKIFFLLGLAQAAEAPLLDPSHRQDPGNTTCRSTQPQTTGWAFMVSGCGPVPSRGCAQANFPPSAWSLSDLSPRA